MSIKKNINNKEKTKKIEKSIISLKYGCLYNKPEPTKMAEDRYKINDILSPVIYTDIRPIIIKLHAMKSFKLFDIDTL